MGLTSGALQAAAIGAAPVHLTARTIKHGKRAHARSGPRPREPVHATTNAAASPYLVDPATVPPGNAIIVDSMSFLRNVLESGARDAECFGVLFCRVLQRMLWFVEAARVEQAARTGSLPPVMVMVVVLDASGAGHGEKGFTHGKRYDPNWKVTPDLARDRVRNTKVDPNPYARHFDKIASPDTRIQTDTKLLVKNRVWLYDEFVRGFAEYVRFAFVPPQGVVVILDDGPRGDGFARVESHFHVVGDYGLLKEVARALSSGQKIDGMECLDPELMHNAASVDEESLCLPWYTGFMDRASVDSIVPGSASTKQATCAHVDLDLSAFHSSEEDANGWNGVMRVDVSAADNMAKRDAELRAESASRDKSAAYRGAVFANHRRRVFADLTESVPRAHVIGVPGANGETPVTKTKRVLLRYSARTSVHPDLCEADDRLKTWLIAFRDQHRVVVSIDGDTTITVAMLYSLELKAQREEELNGKYHHPRINVAREIPLEKPREAVAVAVTPSAELKEGEQTLENAWTGGKRKRKSAAEEAIEEEAMARLDYELSGVEAMGVSFSTFFEQRKVEALTNPAPPAPKFRSREQRGRVRCRQYVNLTYMVEAVASRMTMALASGASAHPGPRADRGTRKAMEERSWGLAGLYYCAVLMAGCDFVETDREVEPGGINITVGEACYATLALVHAVARSEGGKAVCEPQHWLWRTPPHEGLTEPPLERTTDAFHELVGGPSHEAVLGIASIALARANLTKKDKSEEEASTGTIALTPVERATAAHYFSVAIHCESTEHVPYLEQFRRFMAKGTEDPPEELRTFVAENIGYRKARRGSIGGRGENCADRGVAEEAARRWACRTGRVVFTVRKFLGSHLPGKALDGAGAIVHEKEEEEKEDGHRVSRPLGFVDSELGWDGMATYGHCWERPKKRAWKASTTDNAKAALSVCAPRPRPRTTDDYLAMRSRIAKKGKRALRKATA